MRFTAPSKTQVNRDYLIAGALLADVGKLLEFEIVDGKPVKSNYGKHIRHPFSGVGLAFKYGSTFGGHAYHRYPFQRRDRGEALPGEHHLPPRRFH